MVYLLHDVQLRVLRLKELDEELQHLRVEQLVTCADLREETFRSEHRRSTKEKSQVSSRVVCVPHPVEPGALVCGPSGAGSSVAQTLSSQPTSEPPSRQLGT